MHSISIDWIFLVSLLVSAFDNPNQNINNSEKNIASDIPQKSDLEALVASLEKLIKYYIKHPNDIDVNSVFGFFLLNVNLNSVLKNKAKDLPLLLANRFRNIVEKNKRIVAYFRMMASQSQVQLPRHKKLKKITTLFSNESFWVSQAKHIDNEQIMETPSISPQEVTLHFSSWPEYKEEIEEIARMMPPFALTEKCLIIIAENPVYYGNSTLPKCVLPHECSNGIAAGNDIGFGLTNRLLILIQARFGRRCTVFGEAEDANLIDKLCKTCYKEAMFISLNKYDPTILMIEQLTLCSLNGNVEFLRRPWLAFILALQTEYGCFTDHVVYAKGRSKPLKEVKPSRWNLDKENHHQADTHCYGPASAGAAAVISATIKYILELFY